jgi:thioredoxin 1
MEQLTLETFKEKICDQDFEGQSDSKWQFKGAIPAVIDFYADWCGPCKMVAPVLEELSKEYEGRLNIYKVNTDNEPKLAGAFGISSIPSILFVPLQGEPTMSMGALPKQEFKKIFREVLGLEEKVN